MINRRAWVLLLQMRDAARDAQYFVEGFSFSDFQSDPKTQNAVAMALVRIGTNAARIATETPDVMAQVPVIEWQLVRGLRNRIAHDYSQMDMEVIWETMQNDIPILMSHLEAALSVDE